MGEIAYRAIERTPDDFQQPVSLAHIQAMCARAFGSDTPITSIQELAGGEFNNTYSVHINDRNTVILRVAPRRDVHMPWHEVDLMRREQSLQPYFAPIATLLPKTILADFTHQIIERDYMFQTCMPGEQWARLAKDLSIEENSMLWHQFGRIAKTISSVEGTFFGHPCTGSQFSTWSSTVLNWLEQAMKDAHDAQLETGHLRSILALVAAHICIFDEINIPRLLHGDLWPFNMLVERKEQGPTIVAVLDADRGYWGDPLADWTFFLLPRRATAHEQAIFWQEFGQPEDTPGTRFRAEVYKSIHQGNILSLAHSRHHDNVAIEAHKALQNIATALQAMSL